MIGISACLFKFVAVVIGAERYVKWLGYTPTDSADYFRAAEQCWIKVEQAKYYRAEIDFCRGNPRVIPSGMKTVSSVVQQLKLFLDSHGILRCQTRLEDPDMSYSARCPILLPKRSHYTKLLVWAIHQRVGHAGVLQTLSQLRQEYWVPQGRQLARNVVRQCIQCRKVLATPYPVLAPPALPDFRVKRVDAFETCGVDFAGPFIVKGKGQRLLPAYICVFTCAVSRAVHLETLFGMSVSEFMNGV